MHALLHRYRLPATLTIATRDDVREAALRALAGACRSGETAWGLDASSVADVDAAGLGVLLLLEKRAREAGVRFVIERPSPVVVATLRAAALGDLLGEQPD